MVAKLECMRLAVVVLLLVVCPVYCFVPSVLRVATTSAAETAQSSTVCSAASPFSRRNFVAGLVGTGIAGPAFAASTVEKSAAVDQLDKPCREYCIDFCLSVYKKKLKECMADCETECVGKP